MTIQLKKVELSNGETLGYRERSGGNQTLLLVHGNMTSSKHWDIFIDALPEEYHIVAIDLRGFGISTYNKKIENVSDFSDDIKLFVDALGLKDFSLMGWSLGGSVSMQFVVDYPNYAKELILLASGSTRGFPCYGVNAKGAIDLNNRLRTYEDFLKDPIRSIPIQSAYETKNKALLTAVWNAAIYDVNQPSPEKYDEYLEDMCTQRNYVDVIYSLNKHNLSKHHNGVTEGTSLVEKINIPTLVLYGDRDHVIGKAMQDELLCDLPQEMVTYVELTNTGHSPLIDDLNQLVDEVTTFLSKKVEEKR